MTQRYPLPLTAAMLAKANTNEAKPRYHGAGVAGDWAGGAVGNEANAASATVAIVNAASATGVADYTPKTQTGKGNAMVPPLAIEGDIGIDYGTYTGDAGRTGTIEPRAPYPTAA
jgi:hypothetical protein